MVLCLLQGVRKCNHVMHFRETISLGRCPNSIIAHLRMNDRPGWIKPAFFVLFGLLCIGASRRRTGAELSSAPRLGHTRRNLSISNTASWATASGTGRSRSRFSRRPLRRNRIWASARFIGGRSSLATARRPSCRLFGTRRRENSTSISIAIRTLRMMRTGSLPARVGPTIRFRPSGRVRMPFKTPLGTERVAVDLFFNDFRATPNASAMAYYCWEAKVTQGGQEWQVALVDNLLGKVGSAENGSLIIRPWADRDKAVDLQYGRSTSLPFTPNVFFGQRACRLDWRFGAAGQQAQIQAQLNRTPGAIGGVENSRAIHPPAGFDAHGTGRRDALRHAARRPRPDATRRTVECCPRPRRRL